MGVTCEYETGGDQGSTADLLPLLAAVQVVECCNPRELTPGADVAIMNPVEQSIRLPAT